MKVLVLFSLMMTALFAKDILNDALLTVGETTITAVMLLKFFSIFVIGFFISWLYKNKIMRSAKIATSFSMANRTLLANLGNYIIIFLTILTSFNVIGLDLSSLTVVAGALSVGIGFGLQNIVSNFISGLILMFEKSVEVGHFIELENGVRGTVSDIRLRATTVTTQENIDILVPNSNFIQNNVTNLTLGDDILRIKVPFGVAYGTDAEFVQKLILESIAKAPHLPHIKTIHEKMPAVLMTAMNTSSIDFVLVLWVEGDDARRISTTTSQYLIEIYKTLNAHGITIPFPQLDVHIKEMPNAR